MSIIKFPAVLKSILNKNDQYVTFLRIDALQTWHAGQNSLYVRLVRFRAKSSIHHILQISRLKQLPTIFSNYLHSKFRYSPTSTISFTLLMLSVDARIECISVRVFSQAVNSISLALRPAIIPTCVGSSIQTQKHRKNLLFAHCPPPSAAHMPSRSYHAK